MTSTADFIIIGGGVMGLATALALKARNPAASIIILEKEADVARHASGRNSGVLHAGFYYAADSLKARFCLEGNTRLREFCTGHSLPLNPCGKLVVARDENDLPGLYELKRRADKNGVALQLIDEQEASHIEPNAATYGQALFSPLTATVDPAAVCAAMRRQLEAAGVQVLTGHAYRSRISGNRVLAGKDYFEGGTIINCAGLYADRIARDFGFCRHYAILPFKGVYLKAASTPPQINTCIYPVPDLNNPFLGVHFTVTAHGQVKIGPTAIPAFWRENYRGLAHFSAREAAEILRWQATLFAGNAFGFRDLAFEEMKKYRRNYLLSQAAKLVKTLNRAQFSHWSTPGIRAQLLDTKNLRLVQDFVVEGDERSVHVLNAVSPAFTCSLPFAEWIVEQRF